MINWLFLWTSKRPPVWESVTENINSVIDGDISMKQNNVHYTAPVSWRDVPKNVLTELHRKELNGQNVYQFENEFFKFVIEKNTSSIEPHKGLIIKPHMWPNAGLRKDICKPFNLSEIYSFLKKYKWVSIGFFFDGENKYVANDETRGISLAESIIYARDSDNKIINVENGKRLNNCETLNCITYINFRLLADESFVICTVNPNLVAVPNLDKIITEDGNHLLMTMNTYNSSINNFLLAPNISCVNIKDTIFVKSNEQLSIKLYENSIYHLTCGNLNKPSFPVTVKTNLEFTNTQNEYIFSVKKNIGYIKFNILTNSLNDKYFIKDTGGCNFLEYIVIKE